MIKKLAYALSGSAVLVLALSGCGDDGNEKLDNWAKTFCGDVQPQVKKIEAANAAIGKQTADTSEPAEVQKTDSKAFQDLSDAYKGMAKAVTDAGAPPVDDGDTTKNEAVKELNSISASYAGLKKKVDALDTKDQAKFADGLKDVATELGKISQNGNHALDKLQSGDVAKAMKDQKSCQNASPSPSTPSKSSS